MWLRLVRSTAPWKGSGLSLLLSWLRSKGCSSAHPPKRKMLSRKCREAMHLLYDPLYFSFELSKADGEDPLRCGARDWRHCRGKCHFVVGPLGSQSSLPKRRELRQGKECGCLEEKGWENPGTGQLGETGERMGMCARAWSCRISSTLDAQFVQWPVGRSGGVPDPGSSLH